MIVNKLNISLSNVHQRQCALFIIAAMHHVVGRRRHRILGVFRDRINNLDYMDDTQLTAASRMDRTSIFSVPARHISEGAAPCPTGLRPARFTRFTSALPGIFFF